MKTERNILIAFLLNFFFALFEFFGGLWTGSIAILSDALHDIGDAISIALAYFLEKKSKRPPDDSYTFGYARYSALGGVITSSILLAGSVVVIGNAISRLIAPAPIRYTGMIVFAVIGLVVNTVAAFFTRHGDSLNQRAVNLHMLEDVLGWALVLIGAIVMRFTDLAILDPLLSMGVAIFILVHALGHLREAGELFLLQTPSGIRLSALKQTLLSIDGVQDVHHFHVWSLDSGRYCATVHAVTDASPAHIKEALRHTLHRHGIDHVTIELETPGEVCQDPVCKPPHPHGGHHHHHHHHH